ncbi:MAG: replication-associated recombination protein A [Ruminococcaceae bacterium]|nr:replication-associated recombination protein A [Oscillospiraceae bacterium]
MSKPLADRVRPQTLDQVAGQKHLLSDGKVLRRIIEQGEIPNLIFYGPSGVGKTTVARIIAERSGKKLYCLNATTASTSDIKSIIGDLGGIDTANGVLLYLDEIQSFNKKQQQILLEYIETGDITLIASTTENPFFYVYNAILSRSTVFEFKELSPEDIISPLSRAVAFLEEEKGIKIKAEESILRKIALSSAGDVRRALNTLELCVLTCIKDGVATVDESVCEELLSHSAVRYDREGDEHYDIVSAYQKSMRGSDPDAAVYYLARLLAAGDLPSACRRLMVCACEDVGLAYPQIIPIVKSAVDIANAVGLPEAAIPLADAVILVALSPKSNTAHDAVFAALDLVNSGKGGSIPRTLQNKHFDGADNSTPGQFYKYPHDFENRWVDQQYLPNEIKNAKFYKAGDNKTEQKFKEYWDIIKKRK